MATNASQNADGESSTRKRPRTEEDGEKQPEVVESPDLWLKDGNIIIRTVSNDSPPAYTLYRVHKHTLGLHCSVFASLFDGPQGAFAAGSEHYDGVPIMDLPDAADDVRDFLKALYFPRETQIHSHPTTPIRDGCWNIFPDSYHGILRLAVKYDAADIRDLLVPLLKLDWPAVFEDWERLQAKLVKSAPSDNHIKKLKKRAIQSVQVILLAGACNVRDVLPVAFYELSRYFDDLSSKADFYRQSSSTRKSLAQLTSDDLLKLTIGRAQLRAHVADTINFGNITVSNCRDPDICGPSWETWWRGRLNECFYYVDILTWMNEVIEEYDDTVAGRDVCSPCRRQIKQFLITTRNGAWCRLPRFFGLKDAVSPNWGQRE
ncbi:hypothetical protein BV25DRAFT_353190 [Artomyces pyxidatus]|uniref:Uncharacterized protein n=1 Tax=Artomyces pyxidatus TaxID=48021 RepID=A0ACB8SG48_9AGAM|nr:hypothetical protein BV25DRAFT_353190 [Artomyces pyxidatus]